MLCQHHYNNLSTSRNRTVTVTATTWHCVIMVMHRVQIIYGIPVPLSIVTLVIKRIFICKKSRQGRSYFRYTILTTQWTFCENIRHKLRCIFISFYFILFYFFFYLFAFLSKSVLCVLNSMENGPIKGAITSILKHLLKKKTHLFSDFCRKFHATIPEHN